MIRKLVLAVLIIISYLCQTTFNRSISIGNITPNLLIILVSVFALLRGKKEGMVIGFFAGLLCDLFYGYADVIGFNALIYMYIGYVTGIFHDVIYTDDIMVPVAFAAVGDFAYNFMFYIVSFALRNKLEIKIYFRNIMLPELIYTVFLTIFLYKLYKGINNRLEKHEKRGEGYDSRNIGDAA